MPKNEKLKYYNELLKVESLPSRLNLIAKICFAPIFTTSLGREDQYLFWSICNEGLKVRFATLQTGKLFPETASLLQITRERYGMNIEELEPDAIQVEQFADSRGVGSIVEGVENRKTCRRIRKTDPLRKALKAADGWITGKTREQSDGRSELPFIQWDEQYEIVKFNPLADISNTDIDAELTAHEIPVNPLHSRGYPSTGCESCTSAIKADEHPRAGQWWWESTNWVKSVLSEPKKHQQMRNLGAIDASDETHFTADR